MLEVPDLRIQQTESGYAAIYGQAEIPLPDPRRLKQVAMDALRADGEDEAADTLRDCDLAYAVARGKDDIEQLIEIVIAAPGDAFAILNDCGHPLTGTVIMALVDVCPDLGSSRIILKETKK
jgi:hypothetical protein